MKTIFGWILIGILVCGGCATTQDLMVMDERLARIEMRYRSSDKKLADLNKDLESAVINRDQSKQDTLGQYAGLKAEFNNLRDELRLLKGQIEELQYAFAQTRENNSQLDAGLQRLDRTITENTDRVIRIENYLGFEAGSKVPAASGGGKTGVPAPKPEKKPALLPEDVLYAKAKKSLDEGKLEVARSEFQKLLKEFPDSKNADNAQFWIGETYYREKWYEKAILEYHEVIKKFPNGNKVPSALLKQGLAFHNIGDQQNARLVLKELIRKYPKTNEASIAQKKLAEL